MSPERDEGLVSHLFSSWSLAALGAFTLRWAKDLILRVANESAFQLGSPIPFPTDSHDRTICTIMGHVGTTARKDPTEQK